MQTASDSIPPLLLKRMQELEIPAWPGQALFERVIVYLVPDEAASADKFIPDGMIYKVDQRKETDKARSPRGVIVSAGLAALDILVSNGMQIGEMVWLSPYVQYRFEVGKRENGSPIEFMFLNVGDVVLSEDILQRVVDGELNLQHNGKQHVYNGVPRTEPAHYPDEA